MANDGYFSSMRKAQMDALGGAPVNGTMPIGGAQQQVIPEPAPAKPAGDFGRLRGFDANNYNDPNMNSVKYTFGRIASKYAPTPDQLDALMADADFKAKFPNATKVGKDSIDFGGVLSEFSKGTPVGLVDVGQAFDDKANTGDGWWWGVQDPSTGDYNNPASGSVSKTNAPTIQVSSGLQPIDVLGENGDQSLAALISQMLQQQERSAAVDALMGGAQQQR